MILFEPLTERHDIETFRSGGSYLDYYLQNEALGEQANDLARTFVAVDTDGEPEKVIGYFTLKLTPQYVPQASGALAELACLARDSTWRGLGLGSVQANLARSESLLPEHGRTQEDHHGGGATLRGCVAV